jgi:hypothetical protein
MANQRKKVGAGWLKTSQDGTKKYVSIVINGGLSPDINLVMFTNGFKEEENQPDYILYLNAPRDAAAAPAEKPAAKPAAAASEFPEDAAGADGEIPF